MVLGLLGTTYHHLDYYPGTTYCQLDNYLDTTHCHLDYYPGTTYHHLDYYPGTTHCHLDYYPGTTNHHLDYYPAAIYRHRSLIIVSTTTSKVSVHPSVRMEGGEEVRNPPIENRCHRANPSYDVSTPGWLVEYKSNFLAFQFPSHPTTPPHLHLPGVARLGGSHPWNGDQGVGRRGWMRVRSMKILFV